MFVKFYVCHSVSCSLCELTLILRVGRKWKVWAGDSCKSTLNIEFEQDWSVGLGAALGDRKKIKKKILF